MNRSGYGRHGRSQVGGSRTLRRYGTALLIVGAYAVLGAANAGAATTGSIVGATYNASASTVSVSNMRVEYTSGCGSGAGFFVYCGAIAGVGQASMACPSGDSSQNLPAALGPLWESGYRLSNGTLESGPRSGTVPAPAVYRVCLYGRGYASSGLFGGTVFLTSADTQALPPPPPALPPAPPPPASSDTTCAEAEAKLAAAKRKLRKLNRHDARPKAIKRAKKKVQKAKGAVKALC
jgi:hypothetical protein